MLDDDYFLFLLNETIRICAWILRFAVMSYGFIYLRTFQRCFSDPFLIGQKRQNQFNVFIKARCTNLLLKALSCVPVVRHTKKKSFKNLSFLVTNIFAASTPSLWYLNMFSISWQFVPFNVSAIELDEWQWLKYVIKIMIIISKKQQIL